MKKYFWIIIVIAVLAIVIVGFFLWRHYENRQQANIATSVTQSSNSQSAPTTSAIPVPTVVYPIDQFTSRATDNLFGTYFPTGGSSNFDTKVCPNAKYYVGYHAAVDLETFSGEINSPVSVYSIADGVVRQVGPVSGYGSLIVIEYTLAGNIYTAYYGHIDRSTATIKANDQVKIGEKIAELGPACSATNGDVRKHLHFGLHKGTTIDDRGYVPDKTTLANWVDPKTLLTNLGAK